MASKFSRVYLLNKLSRVSTFQCCSQIKPRANKRAQIWFNSTPKARLVSTILLVVLRVSLTRPGFQMICSRIRAVCRHCWDCYCRWHQCTRRVSVYICCMLSAMLSVGCNCTALWYQQTADDSRSKGWLWSSTLLACCAHISIMMNGLAMSASLKAGPTSQSVPIATITQSVSNA